MVERRLSVLICLFLFLFFIYLLAFSGILHSSDAVSMFCVTESIVKRGGFSVSPMWWMGPAFRNPGLDGELYSKYGLGQSLLAVPLYWLAMQTPGLGQVQTVMLFSALVTALNAVVVFLYVLAVARSQSTALLVALIFGLCTPAAVYAKHFFSEPLVALGLTLTVYFLLLYRERGRPFHVLAAGMALALTILTKTVNVATVPIFALYAFWPRRGGKGRGLDIGLFGLPLVVSLLTIALYNYLRFGNVLETGYQNVSFSTSFLKGVYGLLLSPGKGLFFYSPILGLALLSIPALLRRQRREAILIASLFVVYCVLFGTWYSWRGGTTNWGPRLIVPLSPLLAMALTPAVEFVCSHDLSRYYKWLASIGFLFLFALSFVIQVVGAAISPVLYESRLAERFPDWVGLLVYNPHYSPLVGYWRLLHLENLDLAWARLYNQRLGVDWLILIVTVGLILAWGAGLLYLLRSNDLSRGQVPGTSKVPGTLGKRAVLIACALLLPPLVAGFSLQRYYHDPHYQVGPDYQALLAHLEDKAQANEALVLDDASYVNTVLNYSKARLNVYSLDKDELPQEEETESLLERLVGRYERIWLATKPIPPFGWPLPVDMWFASRAYRLAEVEFSQRLRLVLYATRNAPDPQQPQQATDWRFGSNIRLLGYDLHTDNGALSGGDAFQLSFLWEATGPVTENYMIFVHLLDESGRAWLQVDRPGQDGYRPTQSWRPGEKLRDNYWLEVPPDVPPGPYHLVAGMHGWETLECLPIRGVDGEVIGDQLSLGDITVSP